MKIRGIANYQFGEDTGSKFFPDNVTIICSKRTGRIRHIYLNGQLLATLRPNDGLFSITLEGAKRLNSIVMSNRFRVIVSSEAEEFVASGGTLFSKHIKNADLQIRPGEEVIVINEEGKVLAVGKAILTGREMLAFKRGVGVKIRRGVKSGIDAKNK